MKKFSQGTEVGGAPIYKEDLRGIFNDELWDVIEGFLSAYNADAQGLIISGCVVTANGSNFDMTAGIVYLAGEFMRVPAAVNQSYTKSIVPAAAINDNRTFADASIHTVAITKNAELVPGTPGSGQYITISSLTSANNYRLKYPVQSDTKTRIKIIPLGVWNMWNTIIPSKVITLPAEILPTMVRSISAIIQDDAGQLYDYMIVVGAQTGGYFKVVPGSKQLQFHIRAGGFFESVEFTGGATANRGYVTIIYEP